MRQTALVILGLLAFALAGCGKRGPLLPPAAAASPQAAVNSGA